MAENLGKVEGLEHGLVGGVVGRRKVKVVGWKVKLERNRALRKRVGRSAVLNESRKGPNERIASFGCQTKKRKLRARSCQMRTDQRAIGLSPLCLGKMAISISLKR